MLIRQNGPGIMLPPLPEGVRASFIQYLDVFKSLERKGIAGNSSDLSDEWSFLDRVLQERSKKWKKKVISSSTLFLQEVAVSHTLLFRKKAQNCHRNMTNNILTACFHIWKKYRTKMQNA